MRRISQVNFVTNSNAECTNVKDVIYDCSDSTNGKPDKEDGGDDDEVKDYEVEGKENEEDAKVGKDEEDEVMEEKEPANEIPSEEDEEKRAKRVSIRIG